MSFSSTPLGQGRRLDHHTFLNKPASNSSANNYITRPSSPPRRQIPASYAYGASTAGTRSPPKPTSSHSADALDVDDGEQPAYVRFARLKQRDQLQGTRSEPNLNPTTRASASTTTASKPEKWSVKDTSVQIASAFHQAATTTFDGSNTSMNIHPTNPNDAWASGITRKTVPRSSSVEYEKETQSTVNRRLGAPPPTRVNRLPNRPIAKSASLHHVPDSEGEEEQQLARGERGKSPFRVAAEAAKNLVATTFFLRSPEPEDRSANGPNGQHNSSTSYDYSAEEREYQAASQKPTSRRGGAAHRRNRISVDNKAYRPSNSDLEDSDEDFEEDGKKTRRRKARKSTGGGPLTTLPVTSYDKRRKKRRGGKANGADGEEDGSSEEQEEEQEQQQEHSRSSEQRSVRGTTPLARAPSVPRQSVPPPSRMSAPRASVPPPDLSHLSDPDASTDVEALHSIPEIEEPPEIDDEQIVKKSFSVGASLGRSVHWLLAFFLNAGSSLVTLLSFLAVGLTRAIQFSLDLFLLKPLQTLQTNSLALAKYVVLALSLYAAWRGLQSGVSLNPLEYLPSLPNLRPSPSTPYQPPAVPPADLSEFADRLQRLESAIAGLSRESQRSLHYIEGEVKNQAELVNRLGSLETRISKESARVQDTESKLRNLANQELHTVRTQMETLRAQLQSEHKEVEARLAKVGGSDKQARALLKTLEERMATVEAEAKEAIEVAQKQAKVEVPGTASMTWLNNIASGKQAGVTIKSTDGQDVTSLLDLLIDSAITKFSKDTISRADFAMHSGGARIIPALTSKTFEIRPATFVGQMVGMITGNGYAIGRPPVTVLHHENHNGYCWPFAGSEGQVGVALSSPVLISDITIDHVAKEVGTDMRTAPRQMEVWGLVEGKDNIARVLEWQEQKKAVHLDSDSDSGDEEEDTYPASLPRSPLYIRIANFTYDIHGPKHIQTFPVDQEIKDLGVDFGVVALLVKNNWGREDLTCLYRLRVHGQRLNEIPLPQLADFAGSR
ncbi:hypothetical protein BXZ70DRAFT_195632 [Cristinia sonorae]|uniref:SUN domain-containing protein n=1 Tax=Cristinia sonorae TaxID=1940300 RepID=A0A8K0UND1_9AGAR|nr:hypothetical protein BXZ70DRAFT_195632 [Cristinia sonorae]